MRYQRRFTGEITAPIKKNQVFVFNSYSNGLNKAGTAKAAVVYFGAKPGVGEGPTGQSYAIPAEIPLEQMGEVVHRFVEYAKAHPELEFLVTPIGVGKVFKRDPNEMASLFAEAVPVVNIILPEVFVHILESKDVNKEPVYDIGAKDPVNYKLIDHGYDCDFNEAAVIKQDDGRYIIAGLANLEMGGSWSGFYYSESMRGFDKVLLPVAPDGFKRYCPESFFVMSCVIVNRNGLWGCVGASCENYSKVIVPIKFRAEDEVKEELKVVAHFDEDFLWKTYEEYIRTDSAGITPYDGYGRVKVFIGDITKLKVDAIVNAANTSLLGGGGIDGAIHSAAGPQLLEECKKLGGCKVGESRITNAYNLPCKKIIHTVGPDLRKMTDIDEASRLLENCYTSVLDLAMANELKSVAFCCISTGIYRFPKRRAAIIALEAICKHPYKGEVHICCFSQEDKSYYDILMGNK